MDDKQRELRRGLCTGTKVAAIMGISKFRTPYDVYVRCKGLLPEEPPSDAMLRGIALERGILDLYEMQKGIKLAREMGTLVHPHEDWMGASPDGYYIDEDGCIVIVDAKTSRMKDGWGVPGTDEVPEDYACQMQWYGVVLEAYFDVPVVGLDITTYFPWHDEISTYTLRPDPEVQQYLVGRCREWWWKHIVSSVAPAIDHSASARRMVDQVALDRTELLKADEEDITAIKQLLEVKEQIKALDKQRKSIENYLKSQIGGASGVVGGGHRALWKEQKGRPSWDTKQLEVDHPELAEQYKKNGKPYRVLRVK